MKNSVNSLYNKINQQVSILPLVSFRVLFGIIMLISLIRFRSLGWVEYQYVKPKFHFTYYGFDWIAPLSSGSMILLHLIMILCCIGIILGFAYKFSTISFAFIFTYCELIDKTWYLNHYYFISIIAFLLIFLPANKYLSLDNLLFKKKPITHIPFWCILVLQFQIGLVYFLAGVAKLNHHWLFEAMPLSIWLPAQSHLPILGKLFSLKLTAFLFSWAGAIFDLCIPFILLTRFRYIGFIAIIIFHLLTGIMFQIGMFPLIMVLSVPIFFPESFHKIAWSPLLSKNALELENVFIPKLNDLLIMLFFIHFVFQLLIPFRYLLYPGNRFWTEQGYRFGWRVMLIEKSGSCTFYVKDSITGRKGQIDNSEYLLPHQEKQMSFQPDMIVQFAQYLKDVFQKKGYKNPIICAECYVRLNQNQSQLLFDPNLDLSQIPDDLSNKNWLYPKPHSK